MLTLTSSSETMPGVFFLSPLTVARFRNPFSIRTSQSTDLLWRLWNQSREIDQDKDWNGENCHVIMKLTNETPKGDSEQRGGTLIQQCVKIPPPHLPGFSNRLQRELVVLLAHRESWAVLGICVNLSEALFIFGVLIVESDGSE